jgi:alkylation response protein AidB-like acyl-CoA dehydrogenase
MDFSFSEEQQQLRNSLSRFLKEHYDFEIRRKVAVSDSGWRREIWRALASELGILGLNLPEKSGGLGADAITTMVVMEEFGRALVVEPYLDSALIAGQLLSTTGGAKAGDLVSELISGDALPVLAWSEAATRYDFAQISMSAKKVGEYWQLDGRKTVVNAAPWASHFLVCARTTGKCGDSEGLSLFIVDSKAKGVTISAYPTIDGRRAGDVEYNKVMVSADAVLGELDTAHELLSTMRPVAIAALCAEAVGVMERLHLDTVEFSKQRRQFGQPISQFQVLQHRMVDMYMQLEMARSASYLASLKLTGSAHERQLAASTAKVTIAEACRYVGQNAVQLHGGMGMTDDLPISHYFKRATAIEYEQGSLDYHLNRYSLLRRSTGPQKGGNGI